MIECKGGRGDGGRKRKKTEKKMEGKDFLLFPVFLELRGYTL